MQSLTIAISGSGGAGVISSGEMLLRVAGRAGFYGMMKKTFSPQIRGGEAAAILRLAAQPVKTFDDTIDLLVALDWRNFARFADEVPVSEDTLVIENSAAARPEFLAEHRKLLTLDASALAASVASDWLNLVFLGILSHAIGVAVDAVEALVLQRLHKHSDELKKAASRSLQVAYEQPLHQDVKAVFECLPAAQTGNKRWLANGNQMAALGALDAGIRFVAAYPITPASDLLEWLSPRLEQMGGHLVQAEDELAAINMTIGAGFGGVPAMTATSGPGMALMAESMSLAVASETPVVLIDVMRGGPSTGIPTKSEQSDFNMAVYGLHGDAPHVVVAPSSIEDCYHCVAWAVELATHLQTLVIVLSDQFLGHSVNIFEAPIATEHRADFIRHQPGDEPYWRYLDTESGLSPMAVPGDAGAMYTADGLEHSQNAVPSPKAAEHQRQLDKRLRKISGFDFGAGWAALSGDADNRALIIGWGSTSASVLEAQEQLGERGIDVACLIIRLLNPLPLDTLSQILAKASSILVVEQNHSAQFLHYLRSLLPEFSYQSLALPGPKLITTAQIISALETGHDD